MTWKVSLSMKENNHGTFKLITKNRAEIINI